MKNSIGGVPFGQERTADQCLQRAAWERDRAAQLRTEKQPVGYEHLARAHEDTARAYERREREFQGGATSRGKSRRALVDVARAAAAAVLATRRTAPSGEILREARAAAARAIQRYDPIAGTATHLIAPHARGIADLAAEATEEARLRWEASRESLRRLRKR